MVWLRINSRCSWRSRRPQVLIGAQKDRAKIEHAYFGGGFMPGDHPVEILRPPFTTCIAQTPLVVTFDMSETDDESGHCAQGDQQGQPGGVGEQQDEERKERNGVLEQAAKILQQRQGPVEGIPAGPVQLIVVLGRFIEGQVQANRLIDAPVPGYGR